MEGAGGKGATTCQKSCSEGKKRVRSCLIGGVGWATNGSEGRRGVEDGKNIQNGNPGKAVGMREENGPDVLLNKHWRI